MGERWVEVRVPPTAGFPLRAKLIVKLGALLLRLGRKLVIYGAMLVWDRRLADINSQTPFTPYVIEMEGNKITSQYIPEDQS